MALTVQARLGRGRTVDTFAATLEVGGERLDVVVKRPRPELSSNQAFVSALLAWGETQAELDHEAVVAVLESGRSAEGAYVIQEHVEGVALQDILLALRKRRRTLSPAHALMIAARVAEALEYLGSEGRRGHGDLDPGEILIAYRGEVRVTDARLSDLGVHVGADLLSDRAPGAYRAPEAATQAAAPTDAPADVYALALVLLEMLIGHPVWTAETMTVADALAALTDFTHIGQASPALTKDLLALLEEALHADPTARPSASALRAALIGMQSSHGLGDDELGLGVFVEAILPPEKEEEAATQVMTADQIEALQRQREAAADWDAASVLIDPEIAQRAAALHGRLPSEPPKPEPPASTPLVAAAVPLDTASVTRLEAMKKEVAAAAEPPPAEAPAAATPSPIVEDAPGPVTGVVELLSQWPPPPPVLGIAGGLLALLLVVLVWASGPSARTVRLRATSEPAAAALFVDGERIGTTPVEREVEISGELVKLRFVLDGFRDHEVVIGTAAGELRYEAPLERLGGGQ